MGKSENRLTNELNRGTDGLKDRRINRDVNRPANELTEGWVNR
jgi:hypothetical protein